MQLQPQDISDIQNYVNQMATEQPVFNAAYNILTNNGYFNGQRWNKVINAVEIAYQYFTEVENQGPDQAFESATYYITYFASIKVMTEEVSIINSLSEQEYQDLDQENQKRQEFESMLVKYATEKRPVFNNSIRTSTNNGMSQGLQATGLNSARQHQEPTQQTNFATPGLSSRIPKSGVTSDTFSGLDPVPVPDVKRAGGVSKHTVNSRVAKTEKVTEVITKEYFAVSSDIFNLKKYPDHFPMAYNKKGPEQETSSKLDEHLDTLLNDAYQNKQRRTGFGIRTVEEVSEDPLKILVPISPTIHCTVRSARSAQEVDVENEAIHIKSSIYYPIVTSTHDKIINFLTESNLASLTESRDIWQFVKKIRTLRESDSTESIVINALYSKLSQYAFGKMINNAIPETITSSDVIEDWAEIYDSVLDYVYSDQLKDKHLTTTKDMVRETSEKTLKTYLNETFESVRDFVLCVVTESTLEPEVLEAVKQLWNMEENEVSLWQVTAVSVLDIPVRCSELGIYVNNRDKFKVTADEASVLFKILASHIERVEDDEDFDTDFSFITFKEREIYRIEKINDSSTEFHFILVRTVNVY